MKVYKVTHVLLSTSFTTKDIQIVSETIYDAEFPEKYEIDILEMTEDEYEALPEFEGF